MGSMVDQKLFNCWTNQRRSFLQKLTRRAPLELPAWSLLAAVIGVVWFELFLDAGVADLSLLRCWGASAMLTATKQKLPRRQPTQIRLRPGYAWLAF